MSYAALPTLRTPRLTLRPLEISDAEAVVDGIGNYDVSRWLGRVPYPYGPDDFAEFLQRVTKQNLMIWAVLREDRLIGVVGLDQELGYWLARPAWGQGFGFEAAHAAVAHWFSNPRNGDLASGHYDDNHRSRRVLSALGFREVGRSLRFARSLAQEVPGTDVVLTRKAWERRQNFTTYTPRLTLRPIEERDAADFAKALVPDVARMLFRFKIGTTVEDIVPEIPRMKWRGYLGFTLMIEHEGQFAGTIGIGGNPASIGYFFDPRFWGQGLMTEALGAFCPEIFARFPISRIKADHFEDNPASGVVLRKIGFKETGRDIGTSMARVEPSPLITYALTRDNLKDRT